MGSLMLNVTHKPFILSVVMLNAVMMSVVAPMIAVHMVVLSCRVSLMLVNFFVKKNAPIFSNFVRVIEVDDDDDDDDESQFLSARHRNHRNLQIGPLSWSVILHKT